MIAQFDLLQLLMAVGTLIAFLLAGGWVIIRQMEARLDERLRGIDDRLDGRLQSMEERLARAEGLEERMHEMEREYLGWVGRLPEIYQRRDDAVRNSALIDIKLDRILDRMTNRQGRLLGGVEDG